jgi:membrane-associated phospholipid phosphatase
MVPIDWSLDPIVDMVQPALMDARLLAADRWLFGETPSLLLQHAVPHWLNELLLIGYLGYFTLFGLPLVLLYFFCGEEVHEEYARALTLLFVLNLGFYVVVPAIGPRFTLSSSYAAPLQGVWVGAAIRDMFTSVPFYRDCFPSGHTAGTLLALIYTRRRLPAYFWAALPLSALCIAATVLCRFHYAVDLICAIPLLWCAMVGSRVLKAEFWESMRWRTAAD